VTYVRIKEHLSKLARDITGLRSALTEHGTTIAGAAANAGSAHEAAQAAHEAAGAARGAAIEARDAAKAAGVKVDALFAELGHLSAKEGMPEHVAAAPAAGVPAEPPPAGPAPAKPAKATARKANGGT
jgi:hypothetical protein